MTSWILGIARMVGLGTAAGVRPWLTLAVLGIVSDLALGARLNATFTWLGNQWVIFACVLLAIFELSFDKVSKVDRLQDRLVFPYRVAVGTVVGAATIGHGWLGVVVGLVVGGAAAWLSQRVKHANRPQAAPSAMVVVLISLVEDLFAFLGALLTLVVSPLGFLVAAVPPALEWRRRRLRRAKYAALRRQSVGDDAP